MFVERRDDLDALRTVMDLMKAYPEKVNFVAPAMPPVEDERGNEVGDKPTEPRRHGGREVKDGSAG